MAPISLALIHHHDLSRKCDKSTQQQMTYIKLKTKSLEIMNGFVCKQLLLLFQCELISMQLTMDHTNQSKHKEKTTKIKYEIFFVNKINNF